MAPVLAAHRRLRHEIDIEVADVGVGHAGVGRIGKGWIVGIAVRRGAVAQRLGEIRLAPGADASLGIGRDVRRVEGDRKSPRLNYSHYCATRMPSSAGYN